MQQGDIVNIYRDPISQIRLEGEAKLISKQGNGPDMEFWGVEFIGREHEGMYSRWVRVEK